MKIDGLQWVEELNYIRIYSLGELREKKNVERKELRIEWDALWEVSSWTRRRGIHSSLIFKNRGLFAFQYLCIQLKRVITE